MLRAFDASLRSAVPLCRTCRRRVQRCPAPPDSVGHALAEAGRITAPAASCITLRVNDDLGQERRLRLGLLAKHFSVRTIIAQLPSLNLGGNSGYSAPILRDNRAAYVIELRRGRGFAEVSRCSALLMEVVTSSLATDRPLLSFLCLVSISV